MIDGTHDQPSAILFQVPKDLFVIMTLLDSANGISGSRLRAVSRLALVWLAFIFCDVLAYFIRQ